DRIVPMEQHDDMATENANLKAMVADLTRQLGAQRPYGQDPTPPEYTYGDRECRPVPADIGAQCPMCGWTFRGPITPGRLAGKTTSEIRDLIRSRRDNERRQRHSG